MKKQMLMLALLVSGISQLNAATRTLGAAAPTSVVPANGGSFSIPKEEPDYVRRDSSFNFSGKAAPAEKIVKRGGFAKEKEEVCSGEAALGKRPISTVDNFESIDEMFNNYP